MPQRVESSVEIEAPVEKVYDYWKTLENLPQFMTNVEEIRPTGPDTTHLGGQGSFGGQARVRCKDDPEQAQRGNRVEHRERPGSDFGAGAFRRWMRLHRRRGPDELLGRAGGKASEVASRIVANPELMVQQDLRNLKDILEGTATPEDIQQRPQQSPPPRAAP